jgi:hypothetical protein
MNRKNASPDCHITDAMLMLAVDGELNDDEAVIVRSHLEACWSCRVRMEKIETAIADVIDYRNSLVRPHLPLGSGPRAMFLARLHELSEKMGQKPLWRRILDRATAVSVPRIPRRLLGPALAVLLISILLVRFSLPPAVSANELLQRAKVSEDHNLQSINHPIIYRRVRIRSRDRDITTVLYRDTSTGHQVQKLEAGDAPNVDLQERLKAARLDCGDPLSVQAFISWRESLPQRTDEITRMDDQLITLHTTANGGPIAEIDLTLRYTDYHAIAETLRFQDHKDVEINELAFNVMPFEAVDASVFAPPPLPPPLPLPRVVAPNPLPIGPSLRDLADAEVQARVALHSAGADLGEQIDVNNTNGKTVAIAGLVDTPERKQDVIQALKGIPYTQTELKTMDEAEAVSPSSDIQNGAIIVALSSEPPLKAQLEEHFAEPSSRSEFINISLSQTRDAMSMAWALRRLSERYTADLISKLGASSQRDLETLVRDHVNSLEKELHNLNTALRPLLAESSELPENALSTQSGPDSADWHSSVDLAFSDAQRIHDDVAVLLAGSTNENVDTKGVVQDLQIALERASRRLPVFGQQVSGKFLSSNDLNARSQ